MAIFSFLEQYDFTDKIILPFCTHEGSGLSTSVDDIKKLVSSANVMKGLAILGSKVEDSDKLIDSWVSEILNESHSVNPK
jgi:flavodoxin